MDLLLPVIDVKITNRIEVKNPRPVGGVLHLSKTGWVQDSEGKGGLTGDSTSRGICDGGEW